MFLRLDSLQHVCQVHAKRINNDTACLDHSDQEHCYASATTPKADSVVAVMRLLCGRKQRKCEQVRSNGIWCLLLNCMIAMMLCDAFGIVLL